MTNQGVGKKDVQNRWKKVGIPRARAGRDVWLEQPMMLCKSGWREQHMLPRKAEMQVGPLSKLRVPALPAAILPLSPPEACRAQAPKGSQSTQNKVLSLVWSLSGIPVNFTSEELDSKNAEEFEDVVSKVSGPYRVVSALYNVGCTFAKVGAALFVVFDSGVVPATAAPVLPTELGLFFPLLNPLQLL
ncbi:hypothetical protein BUALT_Bualt19G0036200 [Buddleja alternifolia]|uniref:Uncharacterized protein n=1 Tax=Buddleja alternifolia TaxID=168488 RepID=A0AAV6W985_9LAMI|nr:hypothetical protein BUALT_Bualt19G0036200 [Buddleja alternifolia]